MSPQRRGRKIARKRKTNIFRQMKHQVEAFIVRRAIERLFATPEMIEAARSIIDGDPSILKPQAVIYAGAR